MSRVLLRRILIVAISLSLGLVVGNGIRSLWGSALNNWTSNILIWTPAILTIALGLFFESRLLTEEDHRFTSGRNSVTDHFAGDLLQLNRELEERASQHQNELARLNVADGMATPEFRWPMTAMMSLSAMMFLALATPTSGLAWSSNGTKSTL